MTVKQWTLSAPVPGRRRAGSSSGSTTSHPTSIVRSWPEKAIAAASARESIGRPRLRASRLPVPPGRSPSGTPVPTSSCATARTVPSPPSAHTRPAPSRTALAGLAEAGIVLGRLDQPSAPRRPPRRPRPRRTSRTSSRSTFVGLTTTTTSATPRLHARTVARRRRLTSAGGWVRPHREGEHHEQHQRPGRRRERLGEDGRDRAGDHPVVEWGARLGYAASGVLHLLLAWLTAQIALGRRRQAGEPVGGAGDPRRRSRSGRSCSGCSRSGSPCSPLWQLTELVTQTRRSTRPRPAASRAVRRARLDVLHLRARAVARRATSRPRTSPAA